MCQPVTQPTGCLPETEPGRFMIIRTLLCASSLLVAFTARAESFLEVVHASALRTTTSATQFVDAGTDLVVAQLRLRLDTGRRAFISYTFEGSESPTLEQFFGPGGSSMLDSGAARGS